MEYILIGHDHKGRMISVQVNGLIQAKEVKELLNKVDIHLHDTVAVDHDEHTAMEL